MPLVDYGSDSGSGSEDEAPAPVLAVKPRTAPPQPAPAPAPAPTASSSSASRKRPLSASPPRAQLPSASGLSLPPPKASSRRVQKFKIDLQPKLTKDEDAIAAADEPPAKVPRMTASTSGSALLSMLPPPKQEAPKAKPLPAPVRLKPLQLDAEGRIDSFDQQEEADEPQALDFSRKPAAGAQAAGTDVAAAPKMPIVRPLSLAAKGKGKAVAKEPEIDFFGLGSAASTPAPSLASSSKPSTSVSAAPKVAPFRPPSPTPEDAYPGYFLHPHTKQWEAYDPAYYQVYYARWQAELEREQSGGRAFDGVRDGREELVDVSAKQATDVSGLPPVRPGTKAVPDAPKPKVIQSKAGRHNQLSALINNAKANREALEEKIAEAKRNKRASGQAYGFR